VLQENYHESFLSCVLFFQGQYPLLRDPLPHVLRCLRNLHHRTAGPGPNCSVGATWHTLAGFAFPCPAEDCPALHSTRKPTPKNVGLVPHCHKATKGTHLPTLLPHEQSAMLLCTGKPATNGQWTSCFKLFHCAQRVSTSAMPTQWSLLSLHRAGAPAPPLRKGKQ
jgi:hypothetical protein